MLFKTTALATEFFGIHPEIKEVLRELDGKLTEWGYEQITLTEILRTPEQQEEIYWRGFLSPSVGEDAARAKARRKFSWHLCGCAADIHSSGYSEEQKNHILTWLAEKCPSPQWELLPKPGQVHDVGLGPHLHLAIRDFVWRQKYERGLVRA